MKCNLITSFGQGFSLDGTPNSYTITGNQCVWKAECMAEKKGSEWFDTYARRRGELVFHDCSIWLGESADFPLAKSFSFEEMQAYMRSHHVAGGLISHWAGLTLSPQRGNEVLLNVAESATENWRMVFTGLPLFPSDAGPLPGQEKPNQALAGVRLFPKSHGYVLTQWVVGSLLDWLEKHALPLFLWHTEIEWTELYSLAKQHPKLSIIVETQREKILYHMRTLYPLMRDCDNVCVETSNLTGQGYLEYTVREFGAERVLYGSFFPVNDPAVSMGMLLDADIEQGERGLISSGNLLRMLHGVRP